MTKTRNKLKITGLLLLLTVTVSLLAIFSLTASADGEDACASTADCAGTYANGICTVCGGYQPAVPNANGAYEIGNAGQLLWFAELCNSMEKDVADRVNNRELMGEIYNEYYIPYDAILTSDVTLNEDLIVNGALTEETENLRIWTAIGAYVPVGEEYEHIYDVDVYQGTFDGRGHTIRGLYMNDSGKSRYAMFSSIGEEGTVKNVIFEDTYFLVHDSCSAVAYENFGKIQSCKIYGVVSVETDKTGAAGVCVKNYGQIEKCVNYADLFGEEYAYYISGITYENYGTVESCANFGILGAEKNSQIGGIAVSNFGTVKNCFSNAPIISSYEMNGGIVLANQKNAIIINCYYNSTLADYDATYFQKGTVETVAGRSAGAFASGEIAYLLGEDWGQTVGVDANPVWATESNKVYYALQCNGEMAYVNSENPTVHDVSVTAADRFDADGKCFVCGTQMGAALTAVNSTVPEIYYMTFEEAADAAREQGGGKIILFSDCNLDFTYRFAEGDYALDLNGKKLICDGAAVLEIVESAFLTIDDSGSDGTVRTNDPLSPAIYSYGDLTIENGNIYGALGISSFTGDMNYPVTLTINGGNITGTVYAAIDTRATAIINGGKFDARGALEGIDNHGDLTVNYCEVIADRALLNYEGKTVINGGVLEGIKGPAIYMLGGEVTVLGGILTGKDINFLEQSMVAQLNNGCTLKIEGGVYPDGFYSNEALASLLSEGYSFYGANYRAINLDGTALEIEDVCYVYPADALAVVIDRYGNRIESFGSINDAIDCAVENEAGLIVLRDTDEDIADIPSDIRFCAGDNVLSGDVVNHGVIDGGVFSSEVTNYGHIYDGSYSGAVHNHNGAKIHGGYFDCEVIIESGSYFISDGHVRGGDHFKLTGNSGTIRCDSHLGSATCISDGICPVCGVKFADQDPNAHKPMTEATCIVLATCEYCKEAYGEPADHVFNDGGDCVIAGCGVRATVKVGDRFYLDFDEAMENASTEETVYAVRSFALGAAVIPEGKKFYGGEYTVTLTEGDLNVVGTIIIGSFILNEDRVITVAPEGTILNGFFFNDVNNSGSIRGGMFTDCAIYNKGCIYNDKSITFGGNTRVEDLGGTVDCDAHFGGEATCSTHPICAVCGGVYGDFDPQKHSNIATDAEVVATCTESGLTAGTHCKDCGATVTAQEKIPALGHAEQTLAGKVASCTESGLTGGTRCGDCGATVVAQEKIPARGHTEETVVGKAASCTENGLSDGLKCTVCGKILTEQTEIAATGHKYDNACDESCNVCSEARTPGGHLDADENHTCDECGAELPGDGLSGGVIAGIVIGSVVALGGGGFALFCFVIKKKKRV